MKSGTPDIFWPGVTDKFAVSSGTSGSGKHLPLTDDRLFNDRIFMKSIFWNYLKQRPNIFNLAGKILSLPGTIERRDNILIGEISGFSALRAPLLFRPMQLVAPNNLNQLPFRDKFETLLEKSVQADIRVIIAVPSWILTLFQHILEITGRETISEVWPNLRVLVCGGVKLANYRPYLDRLIGDLEVDYIETYGASEGYFAYSDNLGQQDMKLVYDNGIFYEFIPDPLPDPDSLAIQDTVPLWEVEPGTPYSMVVSTTSGLWRYGMNDVVEFTSIHPPRIIVKGRLGDILDEYGEALHIIEAEEALERALEDLELEKGNFTIGATLESETTVPVHHWFIQFADPVHTQTLDRLAGAVDQKLQSINRHYAIRRESGALGAPVMHSITQQDINNWIEWSGKLSAQRKLPKKLDDSEDIAYFLQL